MNKILWFDTETTGLNPDKNGIVQLSGIIEIDGCIVDDFNYKMRPFDGDEISQEALNIHGYSKDEIKSFEDPYSIRIELISKLSKYCDKFNKNDKYYPAGYNGKFDVDFLSSWFKKCGDNYLGSWLNWRTIDPLPIINIMALKGKIVLQNHKLETVCNHFGIELKAHDAMSDIKATRELFLKLSEIVKL